MNKRMCAYLVGIVLLIEAALMLLPLVVSVIFNENATIYGFSVTIACTLAFGALLCLFKPKDKNIHISDGFAVVTLCWILMSAFGALPYFITGQIPSYLDAFFETVSGFTTTGSSILTSVEELSKGCLFWRSFTHWIGGMGVLIFAMAALPLASGGGNIHLMRAESPGYDVSKLMPSSRTTAMTLYGIYVFLTVVQVILMLIAGNPLYDSLTLTFGTAGTGGFGIRNSSVADYNVQTQIIITVFMALFGINFSCYYLILLGKVRDFLKNEEVRVYFLIMITAVVAVALNIYSSCSSLASAIQISAFQVSSIMTTTGYATVNFDSWPEFSRMTMIFLMFIGTCMGSTGGGIKVSRIIILFKEGKRQLRRTLRPNKVEIVKFNGKPVSDTAISSICGYMVMYVTIILISVLLLSFDKFDTVSNVSGVIATLNNIGPGFGVVGPVGNFALYSGLSKCVFIADMLLGRLEIMPILAFAYRITAKNVK